MSRGIILIRHKGGVGKNLFPKGVKIIKKSIEISFFLISIDFLIIRLILLLLITQDKYLM
jgi:hypothetical protein